MEPDGAMWVSWVDGWVPGEDESWMLGEEALTSVGRLLRSYHEAVADFAPTGGFEEGPSALQAGTLVCHGDVAPRNTVFRDDLAVALIDWDGIWISDPLWNLCHAIWQFAPVCDDQDPWLEHCPAPPDRYGRIRALVQGYGVARSSGEGIAPMVREVIAGCRRSVERKAAAGSAPFLRMVRDGELAHLDRQRDAAESLLPVIAAAVRDAIGEGADRT